MERIFVTGSTGFIGSRLVSALLDRGHVVRALARPTSDRGVTHERLEWVAGDILDCESLRRGVTGCTQVYHLAAYARNWARRRSTFFQVNLDGAHNVFEAARQAGVQRIVFTSTVVTFGPTPPGVIANEDLPRTRSDCFTDYEASKVAAEQEALRLTGLGVPIVIVNPTRVFGPGKLTEGNSVSQMIALYDRGRFPLLLNGGRDVGNYVFIDDLVAGHLGAMERGRVGERYLLGGENAPLRHLFQLVDELTGRRHRQLRLPGAPALLYAGLEEVKARLLGIHPQITPGWVRTFLHDWTYSCAKAERELGYRITPLREGLRRTLDWLHQSPQAP
jgi:nucleoside-diphosphate-sugar epimerase